MWGPRCQTLKADYTLSSSISSLKGGAENVPSWSPQFLLFMCLSPAHPDTHKEVNRQIDKCIHSQTDSYTHLDKKTENRKQHTPSKAYLIHWKHKTVHTDIPSRRTRVGVSQQWTELIVCFLLAESRARCPAITDCTVPPHHCTALGCYWLTFFNQACQVSFSCFCFAHKSVYVHVFHMLLHC